MEILRGMVLGYRKADPFGDYGDGGLDLYRALCRLTSHQVQGFTLLCCDALLYAGTKVAWAAMRCPKLRYILLYNTSWNAQQERCLRLTELGAMFNEFAAAQHC